MGVEELIKEVKSGVELFKTNTGATLAEQKQALEEIRTQIAEIESKGFAKAEDIDKIREDFSSLAAELKEKGGESVERKSFRASFAEAVAKSKETFEVAAKSYNSRLDVKVELKDMDFDNFSERGLEVLTTQTLPGIYHFAWDQMWLRNILPSITTESRTIEYLQEDATKNADAGHADIWDDTVPIEELVAKPEMAWHFIDKKAEIVWIAGTVRLKRSMLDDIGFLRTYIPQQMVYGKRGIFIRENALILSSFNTNSVAYDGAKTNNIEKIYDAAFGQLLDNHHSPTHILMNHRDVVDLVLNKASGSGEYDLPPGVVSIATGRLTIGGVSVIGLPQFERGSAFVIDNRQSLFASRMEPEVRFFEEDRDNVIKNLITVRGESRAGVLHFDPTSAVKVTGIVDNG